MTPSVVVTDLDGTVVRSDGTISERTRDAILRVVEAGALFVIATGRPPRWLADIGAAVGHHGLAICANGALVYDLSTDQVIESHPLTADVVRRLIVDLRAALPGIVFAVERVDGQFGHEADYHPNWEPEGGTLVGDLEPLLDETVTKLLGRCPGVDSDTLLVAAAKVVGEGLASLTHSSINGLLEISALGVNKASTLAGLLAARGFGPAAVIAFGDMPNDLELLEWAGYGVGVANAHADVLAVVDEVTASNDDDGVAMVLERLFS
jgi:Cof subfamily protein (haloacid dehalogenase superfamily)